jgi:hypothetical protein
MKRFNDMKTFVQLALLGSAMAMAAGPASAIDYYIAAKAFTKTLPDGSTVPMWGYVLDPDTDSSGRGDCYETTTSVADRLACVDALPDPEAPGPRLTVEPDDTALRIFLTNALPEPTSIVIPGQENPWTAVDDNGPTWNDGTTGARTDAAQRVRSFGREANANGGRQRYIWNSNRSNPISRPGTFIYHSGTHPQKQVYMGLYGAVTKDAAVGEIYTSVTYDNEVVLFYSDIDPAFNASVAAGTLTTAIERHPSWFLINGEPYEAGMADIASGVAGQRTLLRFLSAASETHVPVLQGLYMTIHAEDALQYSWEDTAAGTSGVAPRTQYSAMLPPLKTKDAIIVAPEEGRYAVYDGNGYMTNPSDPDDYGVGDTVGGMLRFLSVTAETDSDGDGVSDALDLCPDTPAGETVDADGCSASQLDSDGDGVNDALDLCPDTPAGEAVDADGCSASQTATQLNVTIGDVTTGYDVLSYGGTQDSAGVVPVITDAGDTLSLTGNAWKQVLLAAPYQVTAQTVLEVTFSSTVEGEIHGIGFDTDSVISANRTFQVYGTQSWGILPDANFAVYPGSGSVTYQIPVGEYYTGSFDRLFFANDDDGGGTGVSVFASVRIFEAPVDTLRISVDGVDLELPVEPYDLQQDLGPATVTADGATLTMVGNAWKKVGLECTVGPATRLSFEFSSGSQGEIHGIGLDTDDAITANQTFQIYGTQNWGILPDANFAAYSGSGIASYAIPLNAYPGLSGQSFSRLFFAMDDDQVPQNGESVFSNIVLEGCAAP